MMFLPIQVAVRVNCAEKCDNSESHLILGSTNENPKAHYVQAGPHIFPVSFVCPNGISQAHLYNTIVYPNISSLLEGYDGSVITYGQAGTGKTYTMFGPGIHCAFSESEHGIIPRTLRDIFMRLSNMPERNFVINISWFQILNNEVKDLLDDVSCNVQVNTVSDAFYWLQQGLTNIMNSQVKGHLLFTICLEQQWIDIDGFIQHRLSTMSFCDLAGTERSVIMNENGEQLLIPHDHGLRALENVIHILSNLEVYTYPNNMHQNVPYDQSTLTTLLKDSLGGRAKTLLICCLSPQSSDLLETITNLQVVSKAQNIRNAVVINAFSDNNTPAENQVIECKKEIDTFGLQFASSQWVKLVANAEGLFNRLISNKVLSDRDAEQVEEWLFLKQECEECLSSAENITKLGSIQEEQPRDYSDSASEGSATDRNSKALKESESQINTPTKVLDATESLSDTEGLEHSDSDSHKALELTNVVENMMKIFRDLTVTLTKDRFEHFILSQPKSVVNSTTALNVCAESQPDSTKVSFFSTLLKDVGKSFTKASVSSEPVYSKARRKSVNPGQLLNSFELQLLERAASSGSAALLIKKDRDYKESSTNDLELLKIKLSNAELELESIFKQIKAVKETCSLKSQLLKELKQNTDTRMHAKQKFIRKKSKLEHELKTAKKHLEQANNFASNNNSSESQKEIEKWKILSEHYEQRLKDIFDISGFTGSNKYEVGKLEKSLEELKRQLNTLQSQSKKIEKLKIDLEREIKLKRKSHLKKPEKRSLKDVTSRISHLDQVLRQKTHYLSHTADTAEQQSVRTEIRNLRKTRDHLQEQRTKLKSLRNLDLSQERRLLECDEAIEAIDTAIEVKNERICGKTSILDISAKTRDEGERMLMARLNKLTLTETRTLLYKYFQKVIDLKDTGHRLEKQVLRLEAQQESWEHVLNGAIREATLKGERNAVYLQHQHQQRMDILLRHLTDDTSASSNAERDRIFARDLPYQFETFQPGPSKPYCNDLGLYTGERRLDVKEKMREQKNKFLTRLVSYDRKSARDNQVIPTQNLKQLQTSPGPTTKVTREKNKLIIQQNIRQ